MTDNLIEIQEKILGTRNGILTPPQVFNLFKDYSPIELNLLLYQGLKNRAIDPDVGIVQAMKQQKIKDYIIAIALCLRFNANPNIYIETDKIGRIHILGYMYSISNSGYFDQTVLNTIVIMLVLKGSSISLPIFYKNDGTNVLQWLNSNNYNTILKNNIVSIQNLIDQESKNLLSIVLDDPSITTRGYSTSDISLAIKSFSNRVLEKIPVNNTKVLLDYKDINDSVKYFNSFSYELSIKNGHTPSYLLINTIIIEMKFYVDKNFVIERELEKMLLISIASGTELDHQQYILLQSIGRNVTNVVDEKYNQPYWRKECSVNNKVVPIRLKQLALSLNINPNGNKSEICDSISNLTKIDKSTFKEVAMKRHRERLIGSGTVNDKLVCKNATKLDPSEYNDIDFISYRDIQNIVWCFTSETFGSLLRTGKNPYNGSELPEKVKEELVLKINILKKFGIDSNEPQSMLSSIDKLEDNDVIVENDKFVTNNFIKLASENDVNQFTLKELDKSNIKSALSQIGFDIDFSQLSKQHSILTVAHIITELDKIDKRSVKLFFDLIRLY